MTTATAAMIMTMPAATTQARRRCSAAFHDGRRWLSLLLLLSMLSACTAACAAGNFWAAGAPLDFSTAPASTTNQATSWKNLAACKLTTLNSAGGWCANTTLNGDTKFQLTLPANSYVYGIGIQGRADADEWITSAELFYRPSTETYVSGGVLARTSADRNTITRFNTYFVAQIVYLLIRGVNNWPSLRANIYVAPSAACSPRAPARVPLWPSPPRCSSGWCAPRGSRPCGRRRNCAR